jgi:hypothetical protein
LGFSSGLPTLPSNSLVVGDINIDLNPENYLDSASEEYSELIQSQCFYNLIQSPTRIGKIKIVF